MYADALNSLSNKLNFTYGNQITNYDDGYIGDIFSEIADSNVDIYTSDLFDWGKNNLWYVDEASKEFGEQKDIIKQLQLGQYYKFEEELHENQKDVLLYYAYNYLKDNDIEINEEQEEELENYIEHLDTNDRLDCINDYCNNLNKNKEEDLCL